MFSVIDLDRRPVGFFVQLNIEIMQQSWNLLDWHLCPGCNYEILTLHMYLNNERQCRLTAAVWFSIKSWNIRYTYLGSIEFSLNYIAQVLI